MAKDVNLASVVEQVYKLVKPLDDAPRHRVIRSVLALFENSNGSDPGESDSGLRTKEVLEHDTLPVVATSWMNRYGVTLDHLEQVFHIEEGKVVVIADSVPGSAKKEQTVNCYILEGVRALLETGSAKFTDADADALCERIGCRDKTNHATNRSSAGNKMTGSRKDGFTLVAPGLVHAAKIIKEIANPESASK